MVKNILHVYTHDSKCTVCDIIKWNQLKAKRIQGQIHHYSLNSLIMNEEYCTNKGLELYSKQFTLQNLQLKKNERKKNIRLDKRITN